MKKPDEITTEEILTALAKIPAEIQSIRYFNRALVDKIEGMAVGAAGFQMVARILAGDDPDDAGEAAAESLLPLTFHLGLLVGQEMEASDAFTKMMGGFNGPSTDAGDPEHRDQ